MRPFALPVALRAVVLWASCLLAACTGPVERVFEYSSDGPSRTGLVPTPAGLVLGNEGGALALVSWDGKQVWRVMLGREISARPVATEDTVVAATQGGEWVAVSLKNGQERWRQPRTPQTTPLATDGERVFSVTPDGAVEALDVERAAFLWSRPAPAGFSAGDRKLPAPLVLGDTLCVALGEAGVLALRTRDGEVRWRAPKLDAVALWGEGARLYVATRAGEARALDAATGAVLWTRKVGAITGGLSLVEGRLWLGLEKNQVVALRPEDGAEEYRATLPGPLVGKPVAYREMVVLPTAGPEGFLVGLRPPHPEPAFRIRADSPLRTEPWVRGDMLVVAATDGRVLGYRVKSTPR